MVNALFEHFVEARPLTVMMRAIMERIFAAEKLDALFEQVAERQCTRTLLFSSVVSLMSLVVSGIHPSVSAAYRALEKVIGVSRPALYGKLNGLEPTISQALAPLTVVGDTATGTVSEQPVQLATRQGHDLTLRRVVVQLHQPTRHGETEVVVVTNLPLAVADARTVAHLYLSRWSVEGMFQVITDVFSCELNTLGYPKAALFFFCMAVVASNVLSTLKAALKAVHGTGKIEAGLSDFYVVEEVQGTFRGMMIALPPPLWQPFGTLPVLEFAQTLTDWAAHVNLKRFAASPRGPKKSPQKEPLNRKQLHVATARLLKEKENKRSP